MMFLRKGKFHVQINYFMNEENKNRKKIIEPFYSENWLQENILFAPYKKSCDYRYNIIYLS
jgi:hypothetical protein